MYGIGVGVHAMEPLWGNELHRHQMTRGNKYFCVNRTTNIKEYNRFMQISESGAVLMRKQGKVVARYKSEWAFLIIILRNLCAGPMVKMDQ
jgi:hypothetical protein